MKTSFLACVLASLILSGCQTAQLQKSTLVQARSVTDIYYEQLLTNIAMLNTHPKSLPYFSLPQTGANTTQLSLTLSYTPTADLITAAGVYLGRYLFDKQGGAITGADTNVEQWTTGPTTNPNKLLLMRFAYEYVSGLYDEKEYIQLKTVLDYEWNKYHLEQKKLTPEQIQKKIAGIKDEDTKKLVRESLELGPPGPSLSQFAVKFSDKLYPGWYGVGTRSQVPKDACYVGHCGKTYVWVVPGQEAALSDFALVILDIATWESPDREPRTPAQGYAGKVPR
jgi:hypothetical protein